MGNNKNSFYPKWRWYIEGECVVEILGLGHFPDSFMVRLPNDHVTEVEESSLESPKKYELPRS